MGSSCEPQLHHYDRERRHQSITLSLPLTHLSLHSPQASAAFFSWCGRAGFLVWGKQRKSALCFDLKRMEPAPSLETSSSVVTAAGRRVMGERVGEGFGLSLVPQKLARTETFPFRMMHPVACSSVGPTFNNGSDLYDVAGTAASAVAAGARTLPLQPFQTAIRSPGVGMAASMGFPFTSLQWQELQRQALIYKYMVCSMRVPPELLMPICSSRNLTDPSTAVASHSNMGRTACFNLRFSSSIDPEPGRCRRTDGKKWRCSRDVAPDQKYCERHMHRGRPRSRKPVEVPAQNQPRPTQTPAPTNPDTIVALSNLGTPVAPSFLHQHHHQHQTPGYFRNPDNNIPSPSLVSTSRVTEKEPRYLDPMAANHPWQLMHANVGMRTSSCGETNAPLLQPYDDQLRLNYTDFGSVGVETEPNDQCSLYLNNNFTSLEGSDSNRRQPSRGFIDAWSIASRENSTTPGTTTASELSNNGSIKSPVLRDKNLPFSSLTLSMPSCDGTTLEDMDQIEMGLGVNDSERDEIGSFKQHPSSWINPIPWVSSTPLGGPLGEVLQSSAAAGSNSASPQACNGSKSPCEGGLNLLTDGWGDVGSTRERPPRLDSSPSGVLHRTLVSPSDSSSSSSPTFTAAKSEIALQWLCNSKSSS